MASQAQSSASGDSVRGAVGSQVSGDVQGRLGLDTSGGASVGASTDIGQQVEARAIDQAGAGQAVADADVVGSTAGTARSAVGDPSGFATSAATSRAEGAVQEHTPDSVSDAQAKVSFAGGAYEDPTGTAKGEVQVRVDETASVAPTGPGPGPEKK